VAGALLNQIAELMAIKITKGAGPLYQHISAHDSSHISVLNAYKDTVTRFPQYASHMAFELWQNASAPDKFFLRTVFNGATIHPPECNNSLCPFDTFLAMLKKRLTITNYAVECAKK